MVTVLVLVSLLFATVDTPAAVGAVEAGMSLPADRPGTESVGHPFNGRLHNGVRLPPNSPFHAAQRSTRIRNWLFGTGYLVRGIITTAMAVRHAVPGGEPLVVGNLSRKGGGDIKLSRSHNSGRDVDFAYYTASLDGKSVPSRYHMFGADGRAKGARGFQLDIPRNWAMVRALMENTEFEVQWIIVDPPIERLLLAYARKAGVPSDILFRAERMMTLPGYAKAHDDHAHIRVLCSPEDWARKCNNGGPVWPWNERMWTAQHRALDAIRPRLESHEASARLGALSEITRRRISVAVPEIAACLADGDKRVQAAALEALLTLATEANASAMLKVARWSAPDVARALIEKALPLAGIEGLRAARELMDGTHPALTGKVKRWERQHLVARARSLVRHFEALAGLVGSRPGGP